MNAELSDDIKKTFILPLTIELQNHKEKCFITPQPLLQFSEGFLSHSVSMAWFSYSCNNHKGTVFKLSSKPSSYGLVITWLY